MKIGDIATLPAGTTVWSIALQEEVKLNRDILVKINQTCIGSSAVFVSKQELLYNLPGYIPTLLDHMKVEFGVQIDKLISFTMPVPQF